jgi:hypothetical protein
MSVAVIENLPGVRPFVELGVGSSYDSTSTAQWDVDHWDNPTAIWVSDRPYWFDVTCHVQDVSTFTGRERVVDQFEVGTATITVDNRSGLFDYPSSFADLASDTLLSIRPGRSVRVGVELPMEQPVGVAAQTRTVLLWAGYIDGANPTYDPINGSQMVIECIDAKGDAGRAQCAALASAVGANETVTARINRVLTAAGWPTYRRSIDTSGVQLIATTLDGQCVDLLNLAADSTGGSIFGDFGAADSDPRVAYRQRDFPNYAATDPTAGVIGDYGEAAVPAHYTYTVTLVEDPAGSGLYTTSAPVVTITASPAGSGLYDTTAPPDLAPWHESPAGSGLYYLEGGPVIPRVPAEVCPSNWELTFNRADITTQATLARNTDVTPRIYPTAGQLATPANGFQAGLSNFGVEPFERTDLETLNTTDLDWLGNRILTNRSWKYMPRVNAVTVTATSKAPDTVNVLAAASPLTPARFTCRHRIDGRTVFERQMLVTGVEHSITPTSWEARIALDDATPFLVTGVAPGRWDTTGSVWDTATWTNPT